MADFLAMGGYAEFVWGSFALAAATLAYNLISARMRFRAAMAKLAAYAARRNQSMQSNRSSST